MRLPSGDHDGERSSAGSRVSRFAPEPSAFITHTSLFARSRDR